MNKLLDLQCPRSMNGVCFDQLKSRRPCESTYALTPPEHIAYLSVSKYSGTISEGSMRFHIGCDSSHDAYAQTRCYIEE